MGFTQKNWKNDDECSKISFKNFIFWKHPPFAHKHITFYKHISKYSKKNLEVFTNVVKVSNLRCYT